MDDGESTHNEVARVARVQGPAKRYEIVLFGDPARIRQFIFHSLKASQLLNRKTPFGGRASPKSRSALAWSRLKRSQNARGFFPPTTRLGKSRFITNCIYQYGRNSTISNSFAGQATATMQEFAPL